MTGIQKAIADAGLVLMAAAVGGCLVRGRFRAWWFFSIYLVAALFMETLFQLDRFFTPDFWAAKETVYAALRFAMASELGARTLRAFPGAFATARRLVLLILVVTLAAVTLSSRDPQFQSFLGDVVPRVLNGSVWMMMTLAAVILWYRIPIQPFRKAVLLSYIPYILASAMLTKAIAERPGPVIQYANQLTYVALVAYWNYPIWRRDRGGASAQPPRLQNGAA